MSTITDNLLDAGCFIKEEGWSNLAERLHTNAETIERIVQEMDKWLTDLHGVPPRSVVQEWKDALEGKEKGT